MKLLLLLLHLLHFKCQAIDHIYACDSKIYCRGPILEAVNELKLYDDSKHFVDLPLKSTHEETLQAFNDRFYHKSNITKSKLQNFISEYFENEPEKGLEIYNPLDWISGPVAFNNISDEAYKSWALYLNDLWKTLSRQISKDVEKSEKYSLIYLPNPFIVPGGRFREIYYWDTYWIILGLLHSGMQITARQMIENYFVMIKEYGLVPNGGRKYYKKRSQLPFLTLMMDSYYKATLNIAFVQFNLHYLETEMEFWEKKRSLIIKKNGKSYRVYHYTTETNTPRPESYGKDVESALYLPIEDQESLYSNIAAAAESGWDFSSRWLADKKTFRLHKTRLVAPVDLNAIICGNYKIISKYFKLTGLHLKAEYNNKKHEECKITMMELFYNKDKGVWFDYHLDTQSSNENFYPSNLTPLFSECYHFGINETEKSMKKILHYLKTSGALQYVDGVPASFVQSGQQWDWPNAWAPLVHMIVEGLSKTHHNVLNIVAKRMAEHWLRHNFQIYEKTKVMYEKYDVVHKKEGFGGEYEVQTGFGWTNGVVLDLLIKYGSRFNSSAILRHDHVFQDIERYF